jgi:hypothetical protein
MSENRTGVFVTFSAIESVPVDQFIEDNGTVSLVYTIDLISVISILLDVSGNVPFIVSEILGYIKERMGDGLM